MAVRSIDFTRLSLMDALDLAILVEEEAEERYIEFAEQMEQHHTPEAAKFFRLMAGNEAKHGEELSERRTQRFGAEPRSVARAMIFDVEAPDYDAARAFMSPRRAMEAALDSERKAQVFFKGALPAIQDPLVHDLFSELLGEEVQHEALVHAELAKLPAEHGPRDEDFVDEPAAQ